MTMPNGETIADLTTNDPFRAARHQLLVCGAALADSMRRDKPDEWSRAMRLVALMSREQRDLIVATELVSAARAIIRRETLAAERAAERPAVAKTEDLYLGRFRHGSMDQRHGAVLRGCDCDVCAETRRRESAIEGRMMAKLVAAQAQYAADLRLEWTRELLDSPFALPDGTRVLWGDATYEQHDERERMLMRNATANVEAAARHAKAKDALQSGGVATLRELTATVEP